MTPPMKHAKFHGNRSTRFSEIWNADTDRQTQTDRRSNLIYVEVLRQTTSEEQLHYLSAAPA